MKVCVYCDATVGDDVFTCPHCSSTRFKNMCPRCGSTYEGAVCQACAEADRAATEAQEARQAKLEAEQKANGGLAWKTALTVLMPYVGGYFLINEHVKAGFRVFAIAWCGLMALWVGSLTGYPAGVRIASSLLCLAPIALYLYKGRDRYIADGKVAKPWPLIAFAVLLCASIIGDVAGAARDADMAASDSQASSVAAESASSASARL